MNRCVFVGGDILHCRMRLETLTGLLIGGASTIKTKMSALRPSLRHGESTKQLQCCQVRECLLVLVTCMDSTVVLLPCPPPLWSVAVSGIQSDQALSNPKPQLKPIVVTHSAWIRDSLGSYCTNLISGDGHNSL